MSRFQVPAKELSHSKSIRPRPHRKCLSRAHNSIRETVAKLCQKAVVSEKTLDFNGASEGIRTLDIHVGNVTLYQTELRSLPNKPGKIKPTRLNCKPRFSALNPAYSKS